MQDESSRVRTSYVCCQIGWFQAKNLLARLPNCSACGSTMVLQKRSDIQDKRRYYSTSDSCYKKNHEVHVLALAINHVKTIGCITETENLQNSCFSKVNQYS